MAIEFSCPHCQHLLRTADDKAGLSAKCPACGEVLWVPFTTESASAGGTAPQPVEFDPETAPPFPGPGESAGAPSAEPADSAASAGGEIPRRRPSGRIRCPACSAENDASASVCRYCGTSLQGAAAVEEPSAPLPRTPDVGETLSTAWRVYQSQLGLLVGSFLIVMPLGVLAIGVGLAPSVGLAAAMAQADDDLAPVGFFIGLLFSIPLLIVLGVPLIIGLTRLHLNVARGAPASLGDLLYGFDRQGRALIPGMLVILLTAFVASFVIIGPMLIWPLTYHYVHRRLPLAETYSSFFQRLMGEFAYVLLIGLIVYALSMALGLLIYPCCVGILLVPFAAPFMNIVTTVGYLRLTGEKVVFD